MASFLRLLRAAALATGMAAVSSYGTLPAAEPKQPSVVIPIRVQPLDVGSEIADFYRDRGFRPVWVRGVTLRPEVRTLLRMLAPEPELVGAIRSARSGDPHALTRADLLLTKAYADHVAELRRAPERNPMRYIDEELAPEVKPVRALLDELAAMPDLAVHLESVQRRNPAYDGLVNGLSLYRARWSSLPQVQVSASGDQQLLLRRLNATSSELPERLRDFQRVHGLGQTGSADAVTIAALNRGAAHYERLIEANIERARAIPAQPGGRYVLVDTASARLWMVEDGRARDSMKVIVGKSGMETPVMAGLMRYVTLNPYWNLPPDLIRQRARNAVRRGPGVIAAEHMQVLSDWSESARVLIPRQVNWAAVASGNSHVNLRQVPGPHNMMGAVKFMMPNDLGIYLHDTPFKDHFARADRRISSGCVRVEDWRRLARWIFRGPEPSPSGSPEQQVDLREPVPVYITYLTVLPARDGVRFIPDRYNRDRITTA